MYSELYEQALRFAMEHHGDQKRKGSEVPYATHLVHVAHILTRHGFPDEVVAAALLHDVIEDTPVEVEELEAAFGPGITAWVLDVTEDKTIRDRTERKAHTLALLEKAPPESRAIKAADVLHNVTTTKQDLQAEGPEIWDRFNVPRDRKLRYYHDVLATLGDGWEHPLVDEARRVLDELEALE